MISIRVPLAPYIHGEALTDGARAAPRPAVPNGPAPDARAPHIPLRTLLPWLWVAWTVVAVVLCVAAHAAALVAGEADPFADVLARGIWRCWIWVPPTAAAVLLTARYPLEPGRLLRNGFIHLGLAFPIVVARVAVFHFGGLELGILTPGAMSFGLAVAVLGGEGLLTYALLVGVAHAVGYARTVRERELARSELAAELARAQLHALKMQLHPHFLFNTLHAISTLVHTDTDRAERMIASLSEMLRNAVANQHAQEVALRDELAALEPYLDIERTRFGERLTVEVCADDETLDAAVPHLVLQPLVENAIRHGVGPWRRPGRVRVAARAAEGRLCLSVHDDGGGISGPPRPGAVGLANTRARLQRLYGAEGRFAIHSPPAGGTRVDISFPLRAAEPHPYDTP